MGLCPAFLFSGLVWSTLLVSPPKDRQGSQGQRSTPFAGAGGCLVWMLDRRLMRLWHWGTETTAFERKKIISAAPFTLLTLFALFAWMVTGLARGHVKKKHFLVLQDEETYPVLKGWVKRRIKMSVKRRLWGGWRHILPLGKGKDTPMGSWAVPSTTNVFETYEAPCLLVLEPMLIKAF